MSETNPMILRGTHERRLVEDLLPGDLACGDVVRTVYKRGDWTYVALRSGLDIPFKREGASVLVLKRVE